MSKEYRYGMLHRPYGIGCQPSKGLILAYGEYPNFGKKYFSVLVYDRKLTKKEIDEYELEEII